MNSFELIMNKCGVDKVGYTKAVIPLYVLLQAMKRSYRFSGRRGDKPRIFNNTSSNKVLMDLEFTGLGIRPSMSSYSLQESTMGVS